MVLIEYKELLRPKKDDYYLDISKLVAARSTCIRRQYGAIIVKDDRIVSTGYNGAPSGRKNCCDIGRCYRDELKIPSGERYELCRSVHAEMNAIINASKEEMKDATMYLVGLQNDSTMIESKPCSMCKRMIINSGISKLVTHTGVQDVSDWITEDDTLFINEKE